MDVRIFIVCKGTHVLADVSIIAHDYNPSLICSTCFLQCWSPASFVESQTGFWSFLGVFQIKNVWFQQMHEASLIVIAVDGQATISLQTQGFCWIKLVRSHLLLMLWLKLNEGLVSQWPRYTPLASLVNRSATVPEDKKTVTSVDCDCALPILASADVNEWYEMNEW